MKFTRRTVLVLLVFATIIVIATPGAARATRESARHKTGTPSVTITGKCSRTNGGAFHIIGTGFKPGSEVMMATFYPKTSRYHGGFYFFYTNYEVFTARSDGTVREKPWDCLYGVNKAPDPAGTYTVDGFEVDSGRHAPPAHFTIIP